MAHLPLIHTTRESGETARCIYKNSPGLTTTRGPLRRACPPTRTPLAAAHVSVTAFAAARAGLL